MLAFQLNLIFSFPPIFFGLTEFARPLTLDTVCLCRSAVRFSDCCVSKNPLKIPIAILRGCVHRLLDEWYLSGKF